MLTGLIRFAAVAGSLLLCCATQAQVAVSAPSEKPARTELPSEAMTIPMGLHRSQPVVEVMVNGKGPYKFLFDTGAAGCGRISAALAEELDLPEVGEVLVSDPSGRNRERAKRVGIDTIALGAARFHGIQILRRDYKNEIDEQRAGIHGILGFGLFRDVLLTLDYPGGRLVLERAALPEPDGRTIFAFEAGDGIPRIGLDVAGTTVPADIDSGSMGGLALPKSVADKLTFKRPPVVVGKASTGFNEFEIRMGPLDGDVRLGSHVLTDPSVEIFDIFPHANLGGRFLQRFRITLDQENRRVRFESDGSRPTLAPRYRVGLMMRPDGDEMVVDTVLAGPAKEAGVEAGDRIVKVNGQSPGKADLPGIFGTPKPIELVVLRAGEERRITVTPAKVE